MSDLIHVMENCNTLGINIMDNMDKIAREIHILLFADDIILVTPTSQELQKKINFLSTYIKENSLTPNIGKTKIVIFRKGGGRLRNDDKFKWEEKDIEIVSKLQIPGNHVFIIRSIPTTKNPSHSQSKRSSCYYLENN